LVAPITPIRESCYMYANLSNDYISNAIDELAACLGVKEESPCHDLLALLRKKETQACVQQIASRLGLPVRIVLSYMPKDFRPGDANKFCTSALSRTDWTGRGIGGIAAQVAIPAILPMYGTSSLEGYPIRVRVSENCLERPATFIAVMAHELSHVLLGSLIHPQKDNDLYADLVPLLQGFRDIIMTGRKTVESKRSGDSITECTTTYGYLTDSQFRFACDRIRGIIEVHRRHRKRLLKQVALVRRKLAKATQRLARYHDYLQYLDAHPSDRMKTEDACKIVQFHALDYTREWDLAITQGTTTLTPIETFARDPGSLYTPSSLKQLTEYSRRLDSVSEHLDHVVRAISEDLRVARRHVCLFYRLRSILWPGSHLDGAGTTDHSRMS